MWHAEHTLDTTAPPDRIWQQMQQVSDWPRWDTGLISAELPGGFAVGAQGSMKFRSENPRRRCGISMCRKPARSAPA
jgi:hypothetical protein